MSTESLKPGPNQSVEPGKIILSQGSPGNALIILHQGAISLRLSPDIATDKNISTSFYATTINGPAILGASAILSNMPNFYHAISETKCVISVYAANYSSLLKIIQSKPQIAILTLSTIIKEINQIQEKIARTQSFLKYAANVQYVLSFAFSKIHPEQFTPEKLNGESQGHDLTINAARESVQKLTAKGFKVPDTIDINYLKKDFTGVIGMNSQSTPSIDNESMDYYQEFMSLEPAILSAIAQKKPQFIALNGRKFAQEFININVDLVETFNECTEVCDLILLGEYSWLEKYALQSEIALKEKKQDITLMNSCHFLIESTRMVHDQFQKLWAQNRYNIESLPVNKINQYLTFCRQQQANEPVVVQSQDTGIDAGTSNITKDSLNKILQYSELEPEKQKQFKDLLEKFKKFPNPMEADDDLKKIKRTIAPIYWLIYEKCILKYLSKKEPSSKLIEIFLLTGFMDETLMDPEHINYIFSNVKRVSSKYPIHDAIGWLEQIYLGKIPTSINELGVSFFEMLRQDNRDAGWKRESDLPANVNSPEARVRFEVHNMLTSTVKLTSGSIINHFPILTKYHFTQAIERTYVTPERLEGEIDKLLKIDFSAYHREILYMNEKLGIPKEFIQMQVIPNMLLVPSIGTVFQFWQEREGNNRTSPGRLICPIFVLDDLYEMLLHVSAAYRWELTKTLLGPDWNNISSSSLTADYTDYVQFFKKNKDLTQENKEKLATEFKRFRDDRARFINDYSIWIKFESEGTQRLNKVARKIMAKHIPFTKGIRENLLKLPSFTDIIQKSINIKKRKAIELEPKYKKYRAENNGILPPELESTIKYYLLDY
ncbi:MAG: cyclic nucleotide-binding domain-containing protein [Spirochaetia bacterium]|nr:cyclic nucleotide-binding domain-containing protein [Spirochaetia bacterium]